MLAEYVYNTPLSYFSERQLHGGHSNTVFLRYAARPVLLVDVRDAVTECEDTVRFSPSKCFNMTEAAVIVSKKIVKALILCDSLLCFCYDFIRMRC